MQPLAAISIKVKVFYDLIVYSQVVHNRGLAPSDVDKAGDVARFPWLEPRICSSCSRTEGDPEADVSDPSEITGESAWELVPELSSSEFSLFSSF